MPFDACMMRAVIHEMTEDFEGARIEKVLMPQNDEIDFVIHAGRKNGRLLLNFGPNSPRMQLTDIVKENPKVPPMFCMLLRKKLIGAKITGVKQIGFDRIAEFTLSATDEMGYPVTLSFICEIMGKYANFILLDEDRKIVSALKVIDFADSQIRQVMPGISYQIPPAPDKLIPIGVTRETFFEKWNEFSKEKSIEKFITTVFSGIATQIAHELCFRATGDVEVPLCRADGHAVYDVFQAWQTLLEKHEYSPCELLDMSGKPKEYSYMPFSYLKNVMQTVMYPTLSGLFDSFFAEKDRQERIHCRAHDLLQLLSHTETRTKKKLDIQRQELLNSEKADVYKKNGDLITANMYQIHRGMTSFDAVDYWDETCPTVTVPLDSRLSPSQNAQKMYKQYTKCKNAKEILTKFIAEWEDELLYLDSVRDFLNRAQTEQDLTDIRDELYRAGYAGKMKNYRPGKESKAKPYETVLNSGYHVLIGRNNVQNDQLTFKIAEKGDIWFHVKDLPGSHVILRCHGEEPTEEDYTQAASLAALHSKSTADLVAVDYSRVKNIKKPAGAKPGFVIYHTNFTAYVHPADPKTVIYVK